MPLFRRLRDRDRDSGFTLIELLVVIIIIGILAAIAIPVFLNQRRKAQDAAAKSDLRNVASAMETYLTDHGTYPAGDGYGWTQANSELNDAGLTPKVSKGVSVALVNVDAANGYCLAATNSSGTPSQNSPFGISTVIYWYDSEAGGLKRPSEGCTSNFNHAMSYYGYWTG